MVVVSVSTVVYVKVLPRLVFVVSLSQQNTASHGADIKQLPADVVSEAKDDGFVVLVEQS